MRSAADVTYNTASFPCLISTVHSLLDPPSAQADKPLLLLAYKQRDLAERELWGSLMEMGVRMKMVDQVRGSEEEGKVEIWVGECKLLDLT